MKQLSRREAIATFFFGTALIQSVRSVRSTPLIFQAAALPDYHQAGFMRVQLADFPELQTAGGSVRLGTSPVRQYSENGEIHVKQSGLFPPIIITRLSDPEFIVLSAECTHEGCSVPPLQRSASFMECPCHHSRYAPDGTVIRGPAMQDLRRFNFTGDAAGLKIELPDVFFEITSAPANSKARMELKFIGFSALTYQIFSTGTIGTEPRLANFALTPDGPLDQTEISGTDDYLSVYVERPGAGGFFHVAMKTERV